MLRPVDVGAVWLLPLCAATRRLKESCTVSHCITIVSCDVAGNVDLCHGARGEHLLIATSVAGFSLIVERVGRHKDLNKKENPKFLRHQQVCRTPQLFVGHVSSLAINL